MECLRQLTAPTPQPDNEEIASDGDGSVERKAADGSDTKRENDQRESSGHFLVVVKRQLLVSHPLDWGSRKL